MRVKAALLIVLGILVAQAFGSTPALAGCTFYPNSMAVDYDPPYGAACSGTGPGCHECYTPSTGGGTQSSVCVWDSPQAEYCLWFDAANQQV